MSIDEALDLLYENGKLYDKDGVLTEIGIEVLQTLDGVSLRPE